MLIDYIYILGGLIFFFFLGVLNYVNAKWFIMRCRWCNEYMLQAATLKDVYKTWGKYRLAKDVLLRWEMFTVPSGRFVRCIIKYRRDDIAFLTGRQRYVKSLTKCGVAFLMYLIFFLIEVFQNLEAWNSILKNNNSEKDKCLRYLYGCVQVLFILNNKIN